MDDYNKSINEGRKKCLENRIAIIKELYKDSPEMSNEIIINLKKDYEKGIDLW